MCTISVDTLINSLFCDYLSATSDSFREYDMLKTHRCNEFGMEKEVYYGEMNLASL